jgi:hypothetical protein
MHNALSLDNGRTTYFVTAGRFSVWFQESNTPVHVVRIGVEQWRLAHSDEGPVKPSGVGQPVYLHLGDDQLAWLKKDLDGW